MVVVVVAVTVAITELLCLKNVGAQISMFSANMEIEKIKILRAVLELPGQMA